MLHNLADAGHTMALLREARPEFVFHLAGQTGADFGVLLSSHITATANLLEAARCLGLDAVILIPGSSAQFGEVPEQDQPITEDTEYRPSTLYGIAKTTEAWTAAYYQREYRMKIIRTHTFNCIGPGQRPQFVPAAFACQVAAMERGTAEPVLHVGNLESRRDMIDIRDTAATRQLATKSLESAQIRPVPDWISFNRDALRAQIGRIPTRDEIQPIVNEQLIVEFYSR